MLSKTRPLSRMTAQELRESSGMGLQEAQRQIAVSRILDRVDRARTTHALKTALRDFITLTTGVP